VAVLVSGCAGVGVRRFGVAAGAQEGAPPPPRRSKHTVSRETKYLAKRALDLFDVFGLSVTLGPGLTANGRATLFAQAGLGVQNVYRAGFLGRQMGAWNDASWEVGVSVFPYLRVADGEPRAGKVRRYEANLPPAHVFPYGVDTDRDWFDFGLTAHALLAGVNAEIRGREFADFVLGIFGVDFMRDD